MNGSTPQTLQEKVGQMLIVGFEGTQAPPYILEWLAEGRIGGVILFARNVESPEQVQTLTQSLHTAAKYPILISIDQEGGSVTRMREGFTESPGAMALSSSSTPEIHAEAISRVLAEEMHTVGINWNYAPVVDISYNKDNPTVGTRSFGADKEHIAVVAAAATRGFQQGGVAACAKHFPGLGKTDIDTHQALPILDTPVEELLANDLIPYRALSQAGIASIMTTHTIFSELDPELPATLSPIIINTILRNKLNYDGVVTTDCLEMKAITDNYGDGEAAVLAALAGADTLLVSHTRARQEAAYKALLKAAESGRLSENRINQAVARINRMKEAYAITERGDPADIRSEEHMEVEQETARAGLVLVKADPNHFPLQPQHKNICVVEFTSGKDSEVMNSTDMSDFCLQLQNTISQEVTCVRLPATRKDEKSLEEALQQVKQADLVIVATRNAHRIPPQLEVAQAIIAESEHTLLVALRNPYDAEVLTDADTILCTSNDSMPSLQAAADAIQGEYLPRGTLPI